MRTRSVFLFFILLLLAAAGQAQPCTTLGQTPSTAFPVCGTGTFIQNNVPICGGTAIPTSCTGGVYADVNPFWYRFTCFTSGTLGFIIDPINDVDDYDWVLFDITGTNPNNIFTNSALNIAENWSANSGNTGASNNPNGLRHCAGNTPNFSSLPAIVAGREYLLLVSNWSASQLGYTLTFGGGTAVITDPLLPALQSVNAHCTGDRLVIHFNKKMRCNSVAGDGSDFSITGATVISATGYGCTSSFDFDSVLVLLSAPLTPGNHTIAMATGSDGNTLLDNCGTAVAAGNNMSFTIPPSPPVGMGAITPPPCVPASLTLTFAEPVLCSSVAANGSDFIITGPSAVTVNSATAINCVNGETTAITIQLSAPILTTGTYQVAMATGTDGNTILAQCNRQVTVGANTTFDLPAQPPVLMPAISTSPCTAEIVTLTFAEPVNCNSIAANGSDFIITGQSAVTVISATAINCNAAGETTTIRLQTAMPIFTAGNYQVAAATGSDGNTVTAGVCNRQVIAGSTAAFTIAQQPPFPIGALSPVSCAPNSITINYTTDPLDCTSISPDGSEFIITGPSAVTISNVSSQCNLTPNLQTITLTLSAPIAVGGTYQLQVVTGSDGNTIRGGCNRYITAGDFTTFIVPDVPPTAMDSIVPVACSPSSLRLIFDEPIRCATIAPDGSDFIITGQSPVTILSAGPACNAMGLVTEIDIQLSSPIVVGGIYQLQLTTGIDGNTLLNDCYRPTPVTILPFVVGDTVSAVFQYQVQYDCETDIITFSHDGQNNVNQWIWTVNGVATGTSQSFTQSFPASSQNEVQLQVSNGTCSDTYTESIVLNNKVVAAIDVPDIVCPEDTTVFKDISTGQIDTWQWNFGNGNTSSLQSPPAQSYPTTGTETFYTVSLTVSNNTGCQTTATETIKVLASCIIAIPTAFTPDNDGLNDFLYPLNAIKAENLDFKVFNRWGQLVFQSREWTKKWDGTINGMPQAANVYVWTLNYTDRDTKVKHSLRGTTTLIR